MFKELVGEDKRRFEFTDLKGHSGSIDEAVLPIIMRKTNIQTSFALLEPPFLSFKTS